MKRSRPSGVTRTPEVVVIGPDFVLRYRGRIDDQYRLSGANPAAAHNDLENALEAVLAGKPVAVAETTVDGCLITHAAAPDRKSNVTYHKDVAPILRKHCVECHQPNTEAPFSLLTYEDAKKQGATMAEVVGDEAMPPWYAASAHDDFMNRREMSATEKDTIASWVQAGMPAGEPVADATPIPLRKVVGEGWLIGKPDLILQTKLHSVPAEGFVAYRYEPLPYVFSQDTWIDRIQILPDNPKVVHHCNLILIPAFGDKVKNALFVTGKVPGGIPMVLQDGIAVRAPKMYIPLLQIHFTTNGHPEKCRISLGIRYAREKVQKELHLERISNHSFAIAAGDPHYKVTETVADEEGHHRRRPVQPHARPRDRHDVLRPLPGRQDRDAADGAQLQLRLANRIRLAGQHAEIPRGDAVRGGGPLRQFVVQSIQSRSQKDRA